MLPVAGGAGLSPVQLCLRVPAAQRSPSQLKALMLQPSLCSASCTWTLPPPRAAVPAPAGAGELPSALHRQQTQAESRDVPAWADAAPVAGPWAGPAASAQVCTTHSSSICRGCF